MKCIQLGNKVGALVTACCGGKEELTDLYACNSPKQGADYCVFHKGEQGISSIRLTGSGGMESQMVAVCGSCRFREQLANILPLPIAEGHERPAGKARRMWEEMRARRNPPPNVAHVGLLDCDQHGYGDAIMACWIAEGSKDSNPSLRLKATGQRRELIEMLGQQVVDGESCATYGEEYLLHAHAVGAPPSVVTRGRKLGISAVPARPTVTVPDEALGIARSSDVLIFPQCMQVSRTWPADNYRELHRLLSSRGFKTHVVGIPDPRWNTSDGWLSGLTWPVLAGWMAKTRLVIGNDSGPAHLAGTMRIPTIAILGRTTEAVFAHCPSVRCMSTEKRFVACVGCWGGYGYNGQICERGCAAIANVSPEDVLQACVEIMG